MKRSNFVLTLGLLLLVAIAISPGFKTLSEAPVSHVQISEQDPDGPNASRGGSFCLSVKDVQGLAMEDCKVDFLQLSDDPQPSSPPPGVCSQPGDYYFDSIEVGAYSVAVTCGSHVGQMPTMVVAHDLVSPSIVLSEPISKGKFCVAKMGLPIDLDSPVVSMQSWLGFGRNGFCETAGHKLAAYKVMKVIAVSGPNCKGLDDPDCPVRAVGKATDPLLEGEFQHLLWTADISKIPSKNAVYKVTVQVAGVQKVDVHLSILNGFYVEA